MKQKEQILVSFSGGRSSAVMLHEIMQKWGSHKELAICFANTGKEEEETLRFVDAVDRNFCQPFGHRVVWLEAVVHHGERKGPSATEVTYETADRSGRVFEEAIKKYSIFNKGNNGCTRTLKDDPIHWWLANVHGWAKGTYDTAIGIRADEIDRVSTQAKKRRFIYPLADWGFRKRDVSLYMAKYDWDLKLPGDHWGNCDCCWKKSFRKLMTRAQENPAVFHWWDEMEQKYGMLPNGTGNIPEKPRVFFRDNTSAKDIVKMSLTQHFEPYEDEKYNDPDLFDGWWDTGSGCGESCEIGADE